MKVDIKANSINQVLNADVINIDQIKNLTKEDQNKLAVDLIHKIQQQLEEMAKNPKSLSENDILKIAEAVKSDITDIKNTDDPKSKENKIGNAIKKINEYMGNTSGIILNIVKLAQLFTG